MFITIAYSTLRMVTHNVKIKTDPMYNTLKIYLSKLSDNSWTLTISYIIFTKLKKKFAFWFWNFSKNWQFPVCDCNIELVIDLDGDLECNMVGGHLLTCATLRDVITKEGEFVNSRASTSSSLKQTNVMIVLAIIHKINKCN